MPDPNNPEFSARVPRSPFVKTRPSPLSQRTTLTDRMSSDRVRSRVGPSGSPIRQPDLDEPFVAFVPTNNPGQASGSAYYLAGTQRGYEIYDDARAQLDWNDLTQHACTEIRAANLSGDCSFERELNRGNVHPLNFSGSGARCVRRRAQLSVSMHPGCPDAETAAAAVERAWSTCFADKAPFVDHPRSGAEA